MKVLFIGRTGFISTAVSRMALAKGIELYHLNRGQQQAGLPGVQSLIADIHQPENLRAALQDQQLGVRHGLYCLGCC